MQKTQKVPKSAIHAKNVMRVFKGHGRSWGDKGKWRECLEIVEGVSREIPIECQERVKGVSKGCQGYVKGGSRECQRSVKGSSRECQGSVKGVSREFPGVFRGR